MPLGTFDMCEFWELLAEVDLHFLIFNIVKSPGWIWQENASVFAQHKSIVKRMALEAQSTP